MKLKSLTNKELQDEIIWSNVKAWTRQLEPRYDNQPKDEQLKEYRELHAIYRKYYDEAFRRGMVPKSSQTLELESVTSSSTKP